MPVRERVCVCMCECGFLGHTAVKMENDKNVKKSGWETRGRKEKGSNFGG